MATKKIGNEEIPVLVTTEHKGVFFGYGRRSDAEKKVVTIKRARMCIYWSEDVRGVLGLASSGPTRGCRIGPAVPSLTLQAVTAFVEASPEAAAAWDAVK